MEILPSPTPHMVANKDGAIGWITFSRPARHNAMSVDMWRAIPELVDRFIADDDIRVLVFKGAGENAFVAGADISQFAENRADSEHADRYEKITAAAFAAIYDAPIPTIAMIHGYCIGGGLAIAISCDLRFASEGSTFGIPAARLGLSYPLEATRLVHETVGPAFAKEMLFTGRRFDCEEAITMGLVNRAFHGLELERETRATCHQVAENAPLSISAAKSAINAMTLFPDSHDREELAGHARACNDSEDYLEGRSAFMEKRKPEFHGR